MRRIILKAAFAGMLALGLGAPAASAFAAGEVKVVYHLSEGLDQASRALGNIRNHLQADPDAKIIVVTHGEGIKFLLDGAQDRNGTPYDAAVGALASRGVEFKVCNNTLTVRNIAANKVSMDAKIVPSGVAEVARLQAKEGFAYLHP
jgi:intracellular sulfur oxidation DsrE/DsrF family protein